MLTGLVWGYCRVSTGRQAEDGESLGVQQRVLEGYALMRGWTIERTFVEAGVSGSVPLNEREKGSAMLAGLRAGDIVVTPKLDRIFRSALDALGVLKDFQDRGVSLHVIDLGGDVTGNGIGKLVFTILAAVAEAERDRIRERISTVKADQRARGLYLGGHVPFGYLVEDGKLVPDEAQQRVISQMQYHAALGKSLRKIRELTGVSLSLDAISRIVKEGQGDG